MCSMASADIEHQMPAQQTDATNTNDSPPDDHPYNGSWAYLFCSCFVSVLVFVSCVVVFGVILILFVGLLPLLMTVLYSLPKTVVKKFNKYYDKNEGPNCGMAGIYNQARRRAQNILERTMAGDMQAQLLARAGVLFLVWLVLNITVPSLKRLKLLGSPLWKWSLLGIVVTVGFFCATLVYGALILVVWGPCGGFRKTTKMEYYLYVRLSMCMFLVFHFGLILLLWLFYFSTEQGLYHHNRHNARAFELVTWTCVSLFIGSVLWLVKGFLLLKWSAEAIYRRFEARIATAGLKFLYLGVVLGGFLKDDMLIKLWEATPYFNLQGSSEPQEFSVTESGVRDEIVCLDYLCDILTSLAELVMTRKEDCVPDAVQWFQLKITDNDNKCELKDLLALFPSEENHHKKMANDLYSIMQEQSRPRVLTLNDVKKWMVDAHVDCVNMGRTLVDAKAIVTRLDLFLSFIILMAIVILWLLITGIATTKVLVTIATPFLALTFIFGDTAKIFFQGLIFYFGTHPFDVGDRCILDDTELEVKSISILTTTFIKIGGEDKRIYPNSVLATKAIVNLGWQPDRTDVVELTLDSSFGLTDFEILEVKIKEFLNDPLQNGFYEKSHEVMMKEVSGDKIKVSVHFSHVLNIEEVTHSKCILKKNKQRSKFLKRINCFIQHKAPTSVGTE